MRWVDELICGDCVELMIQMPVESVDLVVTSPPYDDLRKYQAGQDRFNVAAVAYGLWRVLKPGGVVVWVVADKTTKGSESLTSFRQALTFKDIGFNVHDTMIYAKDNPIPLNHDRYEQTFEYMFVFSKGKPKTFTPIRIPLITNYSVRPDAHHRKNYNRGNSLRGHNTDKIKGNIWSYTIGMHSSTSDKEAFDHPAIFPEQLAKDHIMSWSNAGDLVLDPMCGSGTTIKAAAELGRHCLGFDVSADYIAIAQKRLDRVLG
jgi:site-specific DNA-methyltransferase (adenine-specific)